MAEGNQEIVIPKGRTHNFTEVENQGVSRDAMAKVLKNPVARKMTRATRREGKKELEQAKSDALLDPLTGLPNRRWFFGDGSGSNGAFYTMFEKAKSGEKGFIILMMDMNRFKEINDTLGHAAGDALLKGYAAHFQTLIRHRVNGESDVLARTGSEEGNEEFAIARTGGDEFCAILQNTGDLTPEVISKILYEKEHSINDDFSGVQLDPTNSHRTQVKLSIGAAVYDPYKERDIDPNDLLIRADQALYAAKREKVLPMKIWNEAMVSNPHKFNDQSSSVEVSPNG